MDMEIERANHINYLENKNQYIFWDSILNGAFYFFKSNFLIYSDSLEFRKK